MRPRSLARGQSSCQHTCHGRAVFAGSVQIDSGAPSISARSFHLACAGPVASCTPRRIRSRRSSHFVATAQQRAQKSAEQQHRVTSSRTDPQLERPLRQLNNALPKTRRLREVDVMTHDGISNQHLSAATVESGSDALQIWQLPSTRTGSVLGAVGLITGEHPQLKEGDGEFTSVLRFSNYIQLIPRDSGASRNFGRPAVVRNASNQATMYIFRASCAGLS